MDVKKISDVAWMTIDLVPVTRCEPPEGCTCFLQRETRHFSAADAKRHAFENPSHHVVREAIKRTSYLLTADSEEG